MRFRRQIVVLTFMKTFKPSTVERVLWLSTGEQNHLLVKARGRGWFIDTRNVGGERPPSKKVVLKCLLSPVESGFRPCAAKEIKLR